MEQKRKSIYTPVEEEVDAIRDRIWEETKGMSPSEFNEYVERKTAPVIKKFGIKLASPYPPSASLIANGKPRRS
ncbi:MAG: hypothetical protein LBT16_03220 [Treponema sp.]|nr:hypothetical protein [Treponema sp.]